MKPDGASLQNYLLIPFVSIFKSHLWSIGLPFLAPLEYMYAPIEWVSTIKVLATSNCKSAFHGLRPFISHQIQHICFKDISISWHEEAEDSWHEACMSLRPSMKFVVEHFTHHICANIWKIFSPLCVATPSSVHHQKVPTSVKLQPAWQAEGAKLMRKPEKAFTTTVVYTDLQHVP